MSNHQYILTFKCDISFSGEIQMDVDAMAFLDEFRVPRQPNQPAQVQMNREIGDPCESEGLDRFMTSQLKFQIARVTIRPSNANKLLISPWEFISLHVFDSFLQVEGAKTPHEARAPTELGSITPG